MKLSNEHFELCDVNFGLLNEMYLDEEYSTIRECADIKENKEFNKLRAADEEFQIQAAQLFSSVKPIKINDKYSLGDTFKDGISETVFRGRTYTIEDIRNILIFFREAAPSDYTIKGIGQTKRTFNGGVPIFLYAQKFYNNIEYSDWTRTLNNGQPVNTKIIDLAVGYRLKELSSITVEDYSSYLEEFKDDILEFRRLMFITGDNKLIAYTGWKYNKTGNEKWDKFSKVLRLMIVQGWIFNAQCRSNKMILNWADWSNIPEAFDQVERKYEATNSNIRKTKPICEEIGF